jgi:hypothetical protein
MPFSIVHLTKDSDTNFKAHLIMHYKKGIIESIQMESKENYASIF